MINVINAEEQRERKRAKKKVQCARESILNFHHIVPRPFFGYILESCFVQQIFILIPEWFPEVAKLKNKTLCSQAAQRKGRTTVRAKFCPRRKTSRTKRRLGAGQRTPPSRPRRPQNQQSWLQVLTTNFIIKTHLNEK